MLVCLSILQNCHIASREPTKSLTPGYNDPDKVHEEVIAPEVVSLGPTVGQSLVIVIEHAGCIV